MAKRAKALEAPRAAINTKLRRDLRQKLEAAGAQAGRTLSHEIETRLEQSFLFEAIVDRMVGTMIERVKSDTIAYLVNFAGGRQNFMRGMIFAQRCSISETDGFEGAAMVEDLRAAIPAILEGTASPTSTDSLEGIAQTSLFSAIVSAPVPKRAERDAPPPVGVRFEDPENLALYDSSPSADDELSQNVMVQAKAPFNLNAPNGPDNSLGRSHKKKS